VKSRWGKKPRLKEPTLAALSKSLQNFAASRRLRAGAARKATASSALWDAHTAIYAGLLKQHGSSPFEGMKPALQRPGAATPICLPSVALPWQSTAMVLSPAEKQQRYRDRLQSRARTDPMVVEDALLAQVAGAGEMSEAERTALADELADHAMRLLWRAQQLSKIARKLRP
jgi:hypothetical protein